MIITSNNRFGVTYNCDKTLIINPLPSEEWPKMNFSFHYQYIFRQKDEEK